MPIARFDSSPALTPEAKQALRQGSFEVIPDMFKRILKHVAVQPEVDLFASKKNAKLPAFFTLHQDAFLQDWSQNVLYICPPFSQLDHIVEKILNDQAEGILLIPVWKHQPWFHRLASIVLAWWNIPPEVSVLQTPSGAVIPPQRDLVLRVVHFNATDPELPEVIPVGWMDDENPLNMMPLRCFQLPLYIISWEPLQYLPLIGNAPLSKTWFSSVV